MTHNTTITTEITMEYDAVDADGYKRVTGYAPEQDDLARANCELAGEIGHAMCGMCPTCGQPRALCTNFRDHEPALESEDVSVAWQFSRLDPGRYSGPPENCYPAEGGEVLSCVVTRPDGTVIADGESWLRTALGEKQFEDECERALQASIDHCEGQREDAAEWRAGR
jgi:hypothetical protein